MTPAFIGGNKRIISQIENFITVCNAMELMNLFLK